jgi:hypothetical protein
VLRDGRWREEHGATAEQVFHADVPFPVDVRPASLL